LKIVVVGNSSVMLMSCRRQCCELMKWKHIGRIPVFFNTSLWRLALLRVLYKSLVSVDSPITWRRTWPPKDFCEEFWHRLQLRQCLPSRIDPWLWELSNSWLT
jgi:hypothetical protein